VTSEKWRKLLRKNKEMDEKRKETMEKRKEVENNLKIIILF
jgi:hypothetical protein